MKTQVVSRRRFLQGVTGASMAGALPSTFGREAQGTADSAGATLIANVRWMGDHITGQSAEVREWLQNSVIVRAGRDGSFHDQYANTYELRGPRPLQLPTRFGYGHFGVSGDPWLSTVAYSAEVALNNAEMVSLQPAVDTLRDQLNFYGSQGEEPSFCPFAKGRRFPPDKQYKAFAKMVVRSGFDLDDFNLKYYRYFVIRANDRTGSFTPIAAHAYTRRGYPGLRIAYSVIPA